MVQFRVLGCSFFCSFLLVACSWDQPTSGSRSVASQDKVLVSIAVSPSDVTASAQVPTAFTATGTYDDGSTLDISSQVTWVSQTPSVATIDASGTASGVITGTSNISASLDGVTSSASTIRIRSYFYYGDFVGSKVWYCALNADGSWSGCQATGGAHSGPYNISFNADRSIAYVANGNDNTVKSCPVLADGSFGTCASNASGTFNNPTHVLINPNGTRAYVANFYGNVSVCAVAVDGSLSGCAASGSGFSGAMRMAMNAAGTVLLVANQTNDTISSCTINSGDGSLSACAATGGSFDSPTSITLNPAGTGAYIVNQGNAIVSFCAYSAGVLSSCATAGSGFVSPTTAIVHPGGTKAYVADGSANTVSVCPINNDASFGTCVSTATVTFPVGIAIP